MTDPLSARIDHVLVTRFNLPTEGVESLIRAEEGWLRDRADLFDRYCVPSVRAQTRRDFRWIVYLDPESPAWLLDRLRPLEEEGLLIPLHRTRVDSHDVVADAAALFPSPRPLLLTTNLDNDDSIAVDFVARLQDAGGDDVRRAVYVTTGLILSGSELYRRLDRENAFCSVLEPWAGAVGCWVDWHNRLRLHMPVQSIGGAPGWLQVVHGRNVSNRIRGRRVSPERYRHLFAGQLDGLAAPPAGAVAFDGLVRGPLRGLREGARGAAKSLVLAVAGKDGLDRAKARLGRGGQG